MTLPIVLFVFVLVLSFTIVMLVTRPAAASKTMQLRLITIQHPIRSEKPDSRAAELEQVSTHSYAVLLGKLLQQYKFSQRLQTLLVQADSTRNVGDVVIASIAAAAICAFVAVLFLHVLAVVLPAAIAGAMAPYVMLRIKRTRRVKAFNAALPDAVDLMARALRAGHSINSTLELVAEQAPEPLAGEFVQVSQQQKFGVRFRDALLRLGERVPSHDLLFLVTAILVQRETGGDLTQILDRTSHVIRERIRIEAEVRTHTAQGRLTGWILGLLPVIMLLLMNVVSPGYSDMLFHDPIGQKMLYAAAGLIVLGGLVIRKIVDVKV